MLAIFRKGMLPSSRRVGKRHAIFHGNQKSNREPHNFDLCNKAYVRLISTAFAAFVWITQQFKQSLSKPLHSILFVSHTLRHSILALVFFFFVTFKSNHINMNWSAQRRSLIVRVLIEREKNTCMYFVASERKKKKKTQAI